MILKLKEVPLAKSDTHKERVDHIIGPDGNLLTMADLPPPHTRRWVIRRKAEVVAAVQGGLLTVEDALQRYGLTPEEFEIWQAMFQEYGTAGLRTTRVRHYRMRAKD